MAWNSVASDVLMQTILGCLGLLHLARLFAGVRKSQSSVVTSPSLHSVAVVLSPSLMPPSNLRERPSWFQESHGQLCVWNRAPFGEFSVFTAVSGVFDGLMSASVRMHRKRASRSRSVKDVVTLLWRWRVSRNGQGSGAAPGPSVGLDRSHHSCHFSYGGRS